MEQFDEDLSRFIAYTSSQFRIQGPEYIIVLITAAHCFGEISSLLLRFYSQEFSLRKQNLSEAGPELSRDRAGFSTLHLDLSSTDLAEYFDGVKDRRREPSDPRCVANAGVGCHKLTKAAYEQMGRVLATIGGRVGDMNVIPSMHVYLA